MYLYWSLVRQVDCNFAIWGTLPELSLSFGSTGLNLGTGFDKQFCQVCSEGFIPKSTTSNFMLKGNFSCTDMFTIHNNNLLSIKNGDAFFKNEYLTMDQCASFKIECVNCVDEKKDLILS